MNQKLDLAIGLPLHLRERLQNAIDASDPELENAIRNSINRNDRVLASTGLSGFRISNEECLVQLQRICVCFHRMASQLCKRRENRPTLTINDEYDVQDLFHAVLLLDFPDVRKEEWVPSYAGAASRTDFLLKPQETVIEIKKTRNGLNARELGEQLIVDIAKYREHPSCSQLLCFVYDPELRISNPCGIENDLSGVRDDLYVSVIINPKGI